MEGGRPSETVIPPWIADPGVSSAAVVYDLIPYLFPDNYMPTREIRRFFQARELSLRQFDVLLAISEYTRSDLIRHWGIHPSRVVNIGSGASDFFRPPADDESPFSLVKDALPVHRPDFVLSIVGYDWRKNAESLIDAWAAVPQSTRADKQLVLTCRVPDDVAARWVARGEAAGLRTDEIVVTGFVGDQLLRALYQAAGLLVFPSRYEGFGLPVLEAARCGTPSITSNRSSLPEILEMPESTFDPDDPRDIARVITRSLCDDAFRGDLMSAAERAAETHTWDRVAERVIAATAELTGRERTETRPIRVAVVGASDPRSRVREALKNDYIVDEFGAGSTPSELFGNVRQLSSFDLIVAAVDGTESGRDLAVCGVADLAVVYSPVVDGPRPSFADRPGRSESSGDRWTKLVSTISSTRFAVAADLETAGRLRIEIGPNARPEIVSADGCGLAVTLRQLIAGLTPNASSRSGSQPDQIEQSTGS